MYKGVGGWKGVGVAGVGGRRGVGWVGGGGGWEAEGRLKLPLGHRQWCCVFSSYIRISRDFQPKLNFWNSFG